LRQHGDIFRHYLKLSVNATDLGKISKITLHVKYLKRNEKARNYPKYPCFCRSSATLHLVEGVNMGVRGTAGRQVHCMFSCKVSAC